MKIAHITPSLNAYSETFIKAHKDLLDGEVKYFYGGYLPRYMEGYGSVLGDSLIHRGIRKFIFKLKSNIGVAQFSEDQEALLRVMKRESIDVALVEYGTTAVEVVSICKKLDIPLVVHFHGYDASRKSVIEKCMEGYKQIFDYADYIIAVSHVMEDRLIGFGAPPEKIIYNPCAPNDSFFSVNPTFKEKAFVSIGRFVDKKTPYYNILAFKQVLKKHPDAMFYMAGEGALLNTCINLVRYFKMQDNVKFLGQITPSEYRDILGTVKALVQHAVTAEDGCMEGNPVGIMEALAAGVPVISTKHAGIPEVVLHGEAGFLVEEHDVDGMAQYMIKMLGDPMIPKDLGSFGREHVKNNFSMGKHIGIINDLLVKAKETSLTRR